MTAVRAAAALATALSCTRAEPGASATAAGGLPQRIASQTVLSDEVLWDLGRDVQARVIAVSRFADDARYSVVAERWPASVPRTPLTGEALLAANPDLVIIADFTAIETRTLLASAGLPTIELSGFDALCDYRRHATAIAAAVGARDDGERLVAAFDERLAASAAAPASAGPGDCPASEVAGADAPTVASWSEGNVAGRGTTFDDLARAAGLRNVAAEHEITGHRPVAIEQLVAWDPEFLVVPCGEPGVACEAVEREIAGRAGLSATRAGRRGGVIAIPSRELYAAGRGSIDALQRLVQRTAARGEP